MSYAAFNWARIQPIQLPLTKFVLLMLADRANEAGVCWPSAESMVADTAMSRASVFRALDALVRLGYIERQRGRHSNSYRLLMRSVAPCDGENDLSVAACDGEKNGSLSHSETTPSHSETLTVAQCDANHKEPSIEPSYPGSARARALSAEWKPTAEQIAWATERFPTLDLDNEVDCFRDYWLGTGKPMRDWNATYRNWIRRSAKGFGRAQPRDRVASLADENRRRINAALVALANPVVAPDDNRVVPLAICAADRSAR